MSIVIVFIGMLLVAVLTEPVARALRIPFSALLVLVGFIGSELIVAAGLDTGLRWHHFSHLILHVFVPILVFESAFNMNAKVLLKNILPVLLLAIPAMLLAAGVTATALFYGIGNAQGFPWLAALLCGVIVSATDPVAVVALFKHLGAPDRLTALLEGESLFNDATAVVLFSLLVAAASSGADIEAGAAVVSFVKVFLGGLLVGGAVGLSSIVLYRCFSTPVLRGVITVISAYLCFYIAETMLHVSGIVAVLLAGLLLGEYHRKHAPSDHFPGELWEFFAYGSNGLLFLLVGVTVTLQMFQEQWLAMLIGIVAATCARALLMFAVVPAIMSILPGENIPRPYRSVMMWGGLRGAVSLALALSLPVAIEGWYTAQSIVYGVVLFTLFVQAPAMPPLVKRAI